MVIPPYPYLADVRVYSESDPESIRLTGSTRLSVPLYAALSECYVFAA